MKMTKILGLTVALMTVSTVTAVSKEQKLAQAISKEVSNSLMTNEGSNATEDFAECKYVMYIFGASRKKATKPFIEKVTKFYKDNKEANKLGAVYVSVDPNKKTFVSFARGLEMPWKSLDFSKKKLRTQLQKSLKVAKVPSMVIVDGEGRIVLSSSARPNKTKTSAKNADILQKFAKVLDPKSEGTGKGKYDLVKFLGDTVYDKKGEASAYKPSENRYNVVYFSSHLCVYCRRFTPQLVKVYKRKLRKKKISVTFVSSDRTEEEMMNYMKKFKMPWQAMKFNKKATSLLRGTFDLSGLPSMLVFDNSGNLLKSADKVPEIQSILKWLQKRKSK